MFELMPMNHRMPMMNPMRDFEEFFPRDCGRMMSAFNTDVIDNGDSFAICSELPGFKKEDIKISVDNDLLTISAERKSEENEEKPNFVRRERFYGSYSRSFDLTGIDVEGIEAEYTDGVLNLKLPKMKEEVPAARQIEIK